MSECEASRFYDLEDEVWDKLKLTNITKRLKECYPKWELAPFSLRCFYIPWATLFRCKQRNKIMQRIALIEDDAIVRQATSQWLQLAGFDVTAFEIGQDALNAIELGDFQTIISDVRLPDIDGVELLGRFKKLVPDVPVILITL